MKIYVGNLSFDTQEDTLRDLFGEHGDVSSCKIVKDHDTGRSKGFAFVEMKGNQDAITVLDGRELDGRSIRVSQANPQEKKVKKFGR